MSEEAENVKVVVSTLGELVKSAADSPKGKEAANNLGESAVIVTKSLNNLLLPLAAVNAAIDAARSYFGGGFQRQLIDRTKDIPIDDLIEPKVRIAGPALQALALSTNESELRDLFVQLIASTMDRSTTDLVHPSFVEIVRQLEPWEALALSKLLVLKSSPIAQLELHQQGLEGFRVVRNHLLCRTNNRGEPVEDKRESAMVVNFIRLGLVDVDYTTYAPGEDSYSWVKARPEYLRAQGELQEGQTIEFQRGILTPTDFGRQFAIAAKLE